MPIGCTFIGCTFIGCTWYAGEGECLLSTGVVLKWRVKVGCVCVFTRES